MNRETGIKVRLRPDFSTGLNAIVIVSSCAAIGIAVPFILSIFGWCPHGTRTFFIIEGLFIGALAGIISARIFLGSTDKTANQISDWAENLLSENFSRIRGNLPLIFDELEQRFIKSGEGVQSILTRMDKLEKYFENQPPEKIKSLGAELKTSVSEMATDSEIAVNSAKQLREIMNRETDASGFREAKERIDSRVKTLQELHDDILAQKSGFLEICDLLNDFAVESARHSYLHGKEFASLGEKARSISARGIDGSKALTEKAKNAAASSSEIINAINALRERIESFGSAKSTVAVIANDLSVRLEKTEKQAAQAKSRVEDAVNLLQVFGELRILFDDIRKGLNK